MKHKVSQLCRRTDHTGGHYECAMTGKRVAVTPLTSQVMDLILNAEDPAKTIKQSDELLDAFEVLCENGMILAENTPEPHEFETLFRPEITLFEAPFRTLDQIQEGDIVILGAPIDIGTSAFPGTRFGPSALRTASVERYQCSFDLVSGRMTGWNVPSLGGGVLEGARLIDIGDLAYTAGEPAEHYYTRLRKTVQQIYEAKAFPIVLGGDHSITYATVPEQAVALIHLDAHCDLAERIPGHCHHHGNVLRRLLDEKRITQVHHFGLRDTAGWDTLNAGTIAKAVGDMERPDWDKEIIGKKAFISFDVDVLDPTVLPGTGTPVVGGFDMRQLCQILARIVQVSDPLGLDIVELCPIRDPSGNSERVVVEVLLCFLAVLHMKHNTAHNSGA